MIINVLKHTKTLLLMAGFLLVSCVGQVEQPLPWEEEKPSEKDAPVGKRSFLILDFTATWCVNCPGMADAIERVSESYDIIPVSVHYSDEFDCESSRQLVKSFNIKAFPTIIVDFCNVFRTSIASDELIGAFCEESADNTSENIGISLSSEIEDNCLNVNASLTADTSGTYSVGAMLLENGLVAPQTGRGDYYIHNHVLRELKQDDELIQISEIDGDNPSSFSKVFKFELNQDKVSSKYEVVVFVLSDKVISNACQIEIIQD